MGSPPLCGLVFLGCSPLVLDCRHLGTVNGEGRGSMKVQASRAATGMMSHHQGNRVLVLPLGNPLPTLLKRRKALKYALRKPLGADLVIVSRQQGDPCDRMTNVRTYDPTR
jgi:hypothetical protein